MEALLLTLHVVAGILFVGPAAVAVSLFPRYAPIAGPSPEPSGERQFGVARLLHRITRGYGIASIAVPVVGIALAVVQGRLTEVWIVIAMLLTIVAGLLLAMRIAPQQRLALDVPDDGARLRGLSMVAGVFNLLWVVVVVLMIVRPGSDYV